jgi:CubicO group peptidase (beta-lactamase class C family)
MLANGGEFDGARILGRKTLELMHPNHVPPARLPLEIGGLPLPCYGFGLGSRVLMDMAQSGAPGSVGEFGWSGARARLSGDRGSRAERLAFRHLSRHQMMIVSAPVREVDGCARQWRLTTNWWPKLRS